MKKLRKKAKPKVTQKELGKRVGVRSSHISMIEVNQHVPGFELVNKMVGALGHEIVFRKKRASKSD